MGRFRRPICYGAASQEGFRVIRWFDRSSAKVAIIAALVAAFGLAGCGRKGGLDPPPAAAVGDPALAPLPDGRPALGPDGRPIAPPPTGKQRSFLDWLID